MEFCQDRMGAKPTDVISQVVLDFGDNQSSCGDYASTGPPIPYLVLPVGFTGFRKPCICASPSYSSRSAVRPVFNRQGWVTPMHQDCFVLSGCVVEGQ